MFIDDEHLGRAGRSLLSIHQRFAVGARILEEFDLDPESGHIINGHVPVKKAKTPSRRGGKVIVIDGGFCHALPQKPAFRFTLISNSEASGSGAIQEGSPTCVRALREKPRHRIRFETVGTPILPPAVATPTKARPSVKKSPTPSSPAAYERGAVVPP